MLMVRMYFAPNILEDNLEICIKALKIFKLDKNQNIGYLYEGYFLGMGLKGANWDVGNVHHFDLSGS